MTHVLQDSDQALARRAMLSASTTAASMRNVASPAGSLSVATMRRSSKQHSNASLKLQRQYLAPSNVGSTTASLNVLPSNWWSLLSIRHYLGLLLFHMVFVLRHWTHTNILAPIFVTSVPHCFLQCHTFQLMNHLLHVLCLVGLLQFHTGLHLKALTHLVLFRHCILTFWRHVIVTYKNVMRWNDDRLLHMLRTAVS